MSEFEDMMGGHARTIDEHVRMLCRKYGGQNKAARALGFDKSYLSKLRSGKKANPSSATLVKLGLLPTPLYLTREP
jgi:transcriptional regulator with XRE-family HTH domain